MSGLLVPLAATVAAAALTYWFCVRPMRHGHGCLPGRDDCAPSTPSEFDTQLAAARTELDQLRAATARPPATPAARVEPVQGATRR